VRFRGTHPILVAILAAVLFGASTPASKALLDGIHPVQLAGWLYLGAALGVLPALRGTTWGGVLREDRRTLRRLGGAILFGGVLGPIALLLGLSAASAASVSLWLNLELVATAVLGYLVFHDHLGRWGWIAVGGVVGSGVLLSLGEGTGGLWPALLVALACLCWGLDNHLTALIDGIRPAQTTLVKGLVAGVFNLLLAGWLDAPWPGPGPVAGAVAVGTLAYGVSIMLYITAAQNLGATRAQLVFATAPFFGAFLSWLVLGEAFGVIQGVAAGILALSLGLLFGDQHNHPHTHEAMEHDHRHRHDDGHHTHTHPGLPAGYRHAHPHRHEPLTHRHPHWPDIHHRHRHVPGKPAASPSE